MAKEVVDYDEFEVADNVPGAWVGIGKFSVRIKREEWGVTVEVYAKGYEDCLSLGDECLTYSNELADEMAAEEGSA
jgi:hypothetical protein